MRRMSLTGSSKEPPAAISKGTFFFWPSFLAGRIISTMYSTPSGPVRNLTSARVKHDIDDHVSRSCKANSQPRKRPQNAVASAAAHIEPCTELVSSCSRIACDRSCVRTP